MSPATHSTPTRTTRPSSAPTDTNRPSCPTPQPSPREPTPHQPTLPESTLSQPTPSKCTPSKPNPTPTHIPHLTHPTASYPVQNHPIPSPSDPIPSQPTPLHSIPSHPTPPHPTPSHPIPCSIWEACKNKPSACLLRDGASLTYLPPMPLSSNSFVCCQARDESSRGGRVSQRVQRASDLRERLGRARQGAHFCPVCK